MSTLIPNSLGVRCEAERVIRITGAGEALEAARDLAGQYPLVLSEATNVILLSHLRNPVLRSVNRGIRRLESSESNLVRLWVEAGENWHDLVMWCVDEGVCGLENLALIPGSVGAAPVQNIGAYGAELAQFVERVEVVDLEEQISVSLSKEACGFRYRHSVFKETPKYLITAVVLVLPQDQPANLSYGELADRFTNTLPASSRSLAEAVIDIRTAKLPAPDQHPNVGSFFKNPVINETQAARLASVVDGLVTYDAPNGVKLAAAQLIDRAGWRGVRRYGVEVWRNQPLVLVNASTDRGSDFLRMADDIANDIHDRYQIRLELEPTVLGVEG